MNSIERLHLSILVKQAEERHNYAGTGALAGGAVGGGAGALTGKLLQQGSKPGEMEGMAELASGLRQMLKADPNLLKGAPFLDRMKAKVGMPIVEAVARRPKTTLGLAGAGAAGLVGAGAGALMHNRAPNPMDKLKKKLGL